MVCMRNEPSNGGSGWSTRQEPPSKYSLSDRLLSALNVPCPLTHAQQVSDSTYMRHEGLYYTYDMRFVTLTNTPDSPAAADLLTPIHADGCPNAPKTFINQHTCRVTRGCEPLKFSDRPITLDADTLRQFYLAGGSYVFAIDGLRLEGRYRKSPCQSTVSRWRKVTGACAETWPGAVASYSRDLLSTKLEESVDFNPDIRDIRIVSSTERSQCYADSGMTAVGAQVQQNGTCWMHVHPDTLDVYDFSTWYIEHPGNTPSFNPFKNFATSGTTTISFPAAHSMDRWYNLVYVYMKNSQVGRLGDDVAFSELIGSVQSTGFAEAMGELTDDTSTHPLVEVCGSPGEVGGRPELGHRMVFRTSQGSALDYNGYQDLMPNRRMGRYNAAQTAHAMVSLHAPDQLRQRVAFALSQIWVVGTGSEHYIQAAEKWMTYYDIMVRHANGSLRNLMLEASYSPVMGRWLTSVYSKSFSSSGSKPDENYAREIMQLFSIGLWMLNEDGTRVIDADGEPIPTYDNDGNHAGAPRNLGP